ncbi:MAG TPA: hypothetical protein VMY05_11200 [Acidobacteriota bacterium]|nr:hypothetical protein [Acidobacteriota bacterium]
MLCAEVSLSQGLSTTVFPSEDELREALFLGEIDYEEFGRLQEIALQGIDSTTRFLYDQVPNLSYFAPTRGSLVTPLEAEQQAPFRAGPEPAAVAGELRYRFLQQLQNDDANCYRLSGRLRFGERLSVSFKVHREFSGRERFVGRAISYRARRGFIRNVTLGSFTQRLGLGTVYGYRGKLLSNSPRLGTESFLFPDYGGFNGLIVRGGTNEVQFCALGSSNRGATHSLTTGGGMVARQRGRFRPGAVFGISRLERRTDGAAGTDRKLAVNSEYRYTQGYGILEVVGQSGDFGEAAAVVMEGRHRFARAELRYAGWVYGRDYADLTGGSKAANVRRAVEMDELAFAYSTRRSGQRGALIRTSALLGEDVQFTSSLLHGMSRGAASTTQVSAALVRHLSSALSAELTYLTLRKETGVGINRQERVDQRLRAQARFTSGQVSVRSYIALNASDRRASNVSLFVYVRLETQAGGRVVLWSDLARLNGDGIQYWYVFLQNEQELHERVRLTAKFGHTYSRTAAQTHRPVISVELVALF